MDWRTGNLFGNVSNIGVQSLLLHASIQVRFAFQISEGEVLGQGQGLTSPLSLLSFKHQDGPQGGFAKCYEVQDLETKETFAANPSEDTCLDCCSAIRIALRPKSLRNHPSRSRERMQS